MRERRSLLARLIFREGEDMRKTIAWAAFVITALTASPAFAEKITISVNGMVCSFCAQGIKKTLSRKEGVESVDVDLDKKLVVVTTKAGATFSDAAVTESIVDSGYEVTKIERQP